MKKKSELEDLPSKLSSYDFFLTILQVAFICMKLGFGGSNDVQNWNWWMVFCPTWIPVCILIALMMLNEILSSFIPED